ncbi:Uncharacterised protein [Citrobacter koseri]|uniref:Uncharacterized protein n=1 Tax=Citrobacter koseri TaxID=545 RepID=A0A2X2VW75_CITKO|nr:Uncharacterised protein [Citrobacter koseri]
MSPALRFVNRMACMKSVKWGKSEKPEEWDNNKTRNETDIIKTPRDEDD